jgi:hypothetical protein
MDCTVHSIALNRIVKYFDGQWQGMATASDGACYFGASTHSPLHGASFFKYEPATRKLTTLAEDMTEVCGEDKARTPPQGKIHSPIVECDGWLYLTTHLSNYWEEAINKYTGAHVIGYELSTGRFRDLGIVRERYSIYSAIDVDRVNKKLYVFVVPWRSVDLENDGSHLYQIDIATGRKVDLGQVPPKGRGACIWFFIDSKGDCWFTLWKHHWPLPSDNGDLYQFDAKAGKLRCHKDVLPVGRLAPDGAPAAERWRSERSWTWVQPLQGNKQCLFTMGWLGGGDERLWVFYPDGDLESGEAFRPIAYIGATFHSVAYDKKDRVYYVQFRDLNDARTHYTEATRDYVREDIHFDDQLHLRSVSTDPASGGRIVDHGRIVDQDDRHLTMVESMAADDKGNVFMHGSWDAKSPEEASTAYLWQELLDYLVGLGFPNVRKTLQVTPDRTHKVMHRGQFFSHVNVSGR